MNDATASNDTAILPPLEKVFGAEASAADIDLAAMLEVAFDPATPAPEGDLIPDPASDQVDLGDFAEDSPGQDEPWAAEDDGEEDLATDMDGSDVLGGTEPSLDDFEADTVASDAPFGADEFGAEGFDEGFDEGPAASGPGHDDDDLSGL